MSKEKKKSYEFKVHLLKLPIFSREFREDMETNDLKIFPIYQVDLYPLILLELKLQFNDISDTVLVLIQMVCTL